MKPRALLLDAVGTLIELAEPPDEVYVRVASRHGINVDPTQVKTRLATLLHAYQPPIPNPGQLDLHANVEREHWREIIRGALGDIAAEGRCFDDLFGLYGESKTWKRVEDVELMLDGAQRHALKLAIVSNMDARLPAILQGLDLAIDPIVLPSNSGHVKPQAEIFQLALERIGVEASAAFYIGDRDRDCVEAARAAGLSAMRLIGWRNTLQEIGLD